MIADDLYTMAGFKCCVRRRGARAVPVDRGYTKTFKLPALTFPARNIRHLLVWRELSMREQDACVSLLHKEIA